MDGGGSTTLTDRLRHGDTAALAEAYDAHHEHVRAFACRLIGDPSEAEDLVQETFLALPEAIRAFRGEAALRTFLIGIAVNHARHHVRSASRRRAAHTRNAREDEKPPPSTPEDRTRRRELAEALTHALDALSYEHRIAIVLVEVEQRTASEAAAIAGAPEATMRTRVFHAKKKLRELLEKRGVR